MCNYNFWMIDTSNIFSFLHPSVLCLFRQMSLSAVRQAELHSDLKIQEKDELQWKKLKAEGLDENGEKEAQLRRNFNGEMTFFPRLLAI